MNNDNKKEVLTEQSKIKEIWLVEEGKNLNLITLKEALEIAFLTDDSVVVLSKKDDIPVCKIIDISAEQYLRQKKHKLNKSSASIAKKIKISPNIDDADLERKINMCKTFLEKKYTCFLQVYYKRGLRRKMNKEENIPLRVIKYGIILTESKNNLYLLSLPKNKK